MRTVGVLRLLVGLVVAGLLGGALAVTTMRVLQPDTDLGVLLAALSPLAFAVYTFVAVLVLGLGIHTGRLQWCSAGGGGWRVCVGKDGLGHAGQQKRQ